MAGEMPTAAPCIEIAVDTSVPRALEIPERAVQRMCMNYLTNALKYTPRCGRVRLSASLRSWAGLQELRVGAGCVEPDPSSSALLMLPYALVVEVRDTGAGVPLHSRTAIFEFLSSHPDRIPGSRQAVL